MDDASGQGGPGSSLHTAWSMLGQLELHESGAWMWFVRRYTGFVRAGLRRTLPAAADLDHACEEFWAECFEKHLVARADRNRRFRAFLAGAVRNFALAWSRQNPAAPRGAQSQVPVEDVDTAVHDALPEDVELRLFGAEVLRLALQAVRAAAAGEAELLSDFYGLEDRPARTVSEIAASRGQKPNAIHQRLHRARRRLRAEVEREIARTVDGEEFLETEIADLLAAIQAERPGAVG